MQKLVLWVSPWLIATVLVAQQGSPDPTPAKPATAAERMTALEAAQQKIVADWRQASKEAAAKAAEAKADGKPVPAMAMRPDFAPLLEQANAAATAFAGTDDAVKFLLFIVQNGSGKREAITAALDTLTEKHVDNAALSELGQMIPFLSRMVAADKAETFLARLAKSSNPDVRGWVLMAQHKAAIETGERESDAYKTAKMELLKAAELASDAGLKAEITGAIDLREKFGAGNVAPDIEGEDLDGVAFKLSDYKGKVIFLDFWGDW